MSAPQQVDALKLGNPSTLGKGRQLDGLTRIG